MISTAVHIHRRSHSQPFHPSFMYFYNADVLWRMSLRGTGKTSFLQPRKRNIFTLEKSQRGRGWYLTVHTCWEVQARAERYCEYFVRCCDWNKSHDFILMLPGVVNVAFSVYWIKYYDYYFEWSSSPGLSYLNPWPILDKGFFYVLFSNNYPRRIYFFSYSYEKKNK